MYGKVLLTFVKGSKSAEGGPNPLADMDWGGSKSASGYGPGGPNPLGHRLHTVPIFDDESYGLSKFFIMRLHCS